MLATIAYVILGLISTGVLSICALQYRTIRKLPNNIPWILAPLPVVGSLRPFAKREPGPPALLKIHLKLQKRWKELGCPRAVKSIVGTTGYVTIYDPILIEEFFNSTGMMFFIPP